MNAEIATLLAGLAALPNGDRAPGLPVTALLGSDGSDELRSLLATWAHPGEALPTARQVGNRLFALKGKSAAGRTLRGERDPVSNTTKWWAEGVEELPAIVAGSSSVPEPQQPTAADTPEVSDQDLVDALIWGG